MLLAIFRSKLRKIIGTTDRVDSNNHQPATANDSPLLPAHTGEVAASTLNVPSLPVELWLQIIELTERNRDRLALSHTSPFLRTLTLPFFRHLNLISPETRRIQFEEMKVLTAFQQLSLATIVTHLDVHLAYYSRVCNPNREQNCFCVSLGRCLGDALYAMFNLEHLSIHCDLCPLVKLHNYFNRLAARRLRSFSFRCNCARYSLEEREIMLFPPFLGTVEALRCVQWSPDPDWWLDTYGSLGDDADALRNLTALSYQGMDVETNLLEKRPIQRLSIGRLPFLLDLFLTALETFSGSLTPLIMEEFSKLDGILAGRPSCFSNIKHIGTIPAILLGAMAETCLAPFESLQHLYSIDAVVVDGNNPWNDELLERLCGIHRNLRRVLIQGDDFCVWELEQATWKMRRIPRFSSWDIIRGALDDI